MTSSAPTASQPQRTMMPVLIALSVTHLLNDMMQSLIPAIYPIIKEAYRLDFGQIGLITLTFQISASLLQPAVGLYTDKHPMPYSMVVGMGFTLSGLIGLAYAGSYGLLLLSAACVGIGSSIFHPEATRMARNASGGHHGLGARHLPGRRADGRGARAAAGRLRHRAARAGEPRLVLGRGAGRDDADGLDRGELCAARQGAAAEGCGGERASSPAGQALGRLRDHHPDHPAVFEERLFGELLLVLHLLPDGQVRDLDPEFAGDAVPVPRLLGGGRAVRRHAGATGSAATRSSGSRSWARCPSR